MPKGSPTRSRSYSTLAGAKYAPVNEEMRWRCNEGLNGRFQTHPGRGGNGMELILDHEDMLELTALLREAFPGIRFFDVGPATSTRRRLQTIEVESLAEHPHRLGENTWKESKIAFIWPEKGWEPTLWSNELGHNFYVFNDTFYGYFLPACVGQHIGDWHDFPPDYVEILRASLQRGGATPPKTYRQTDGQTLQKVTRKNTSSLFATFWKDMPETVAFARKVIRLGKKMAPHGCYQVNPVNGEVIRQLPKGYTGYVSKRIAERFRTDADFWPNFFIPPDQPPEAPNPDQLAEAWVPETCLPDNDPLAFRD